MDIKVFGLGYVGAVTAACFAKLGHSVVGVDLREDRVKAVSEGRSPVQVPGLDDLVREQTRSGRLQATTNYLQGSYPTSFSFVCVDTPCKRNGDINLSSLDKVCSQIGGYLPVHQVRRNIGLPIHPRHHVVIRSTIFPGTYERAKSILERVSGGRCNEDFTLSLNPEFLREKFAIEDFMKPPFVVIGTESDTAYGAVSACYQGVDGPIVRTTPGVAQMIKYASNAWHACKVAYTNEVGDLCRRLGVDQDELMRLFCMDHSLNVSEYYHKVGQPYGGHCLPKDLSVLQYKGRKARARIPLIDSISKSNSVRRK
jgi:GDP-mannose 6-dehydrogenase